MFFFDLQLFLGDLQNLIPSNDCILDSLGPRTWWWLFGGIFRSCRDHWRDGVPQQKLDPAKGDGQ